MAKKRNYGDGCLASHALDLVGERWALLVVRELLHGPKRFVDLQAGLRGVSSNTLSERLRDLEEIGVLRRHQLEPPANVWVYELTSWGRELQEVLMSLGAWAKGSPYQDRRARTSVDALLLALRSRYQAKPSALAGTAVLRIGRDCFTVRVDDKRIEIVRADTMDHGALLETDARTFQALVIGDESLEAAVADGRAKTVGDQALIQALLG